MTETAARVAGLAALSAAVPTAVPSTTITATAATIPTTTAAEAAALGAVTSNVANLTALVALLPAAGTAGCTAKAAAARSSSRAVTREMAWVAAVVAGLHLSALPPCHWGGLIAYLVLSRLSTLAGEMTGLATVVAGLVHVSSVTWRCMRGVAHRASLGRAVASLMGGVAACVWSAVSSWK